MEFFLFSILFNSLFFYTLYRFLTYFLEDRKLGSNFTSLVHASASTFMSFYILLNNYFIHDNSNEMINFVNYARNFSAGYFLYDVYISYKHCSGILRCGYIYHHIASIITLFENYLIYPVFEILFLAELSNLPSYFVVYYLKLNKKFYGKFINEVNYYKKIQKYFYSLIRILLLGYLCIDNFVNNGINRVGLITLPVYLMGLFWSYKIISN